MKKRWRSEIWCAGHCLGALILGALIYVLLRPDTTLYRWGDMLGLVKAPICTDSPAFDLLRYYIVDALWAYALTFALFPFMSPIRAAVLSDCWGIIWELAQGSGVVSGTFDLVDIIMYLTAAGIAVLIKKQYDGGRNPK